MGPGLPPSLKLRRALVASPGEALAETGRRGDKKPGRRFHTRFIDTVTFGPFLMV